MRAERLAAPIDPLAVAALPGLRRPAVVTVAGWRVVVADPAGAVTDARDLAALGDACGWRDDTDPDLPPFVGGAVGFLTDDLSRRWLALDPHDPRPRPAPLPALWFGRYDSALCCPPDGGPAVVVGRDAEDRERWRRRAAAVTPLPAPVSPTTGPPRLSLGRRQHAAAVERVRGWIAAGDLYQLNLTLQVAAPWAQGGLALARRLEAATPGAAHAAYLAAPGAEIVSVSPETFLHSDGDLVRTRPVKGTRPRGATAADDERQAAALRASAKDAAEHVMIVDLERNDLGRVSRPGSVRVPALAALEAHPTVWHLTSTVTARLRDDVDLGDLLAATFPSGSVTGAPKRMAVARTALVEPVRRGVYCGAIGVVTRGRVDLSVAIRTAVVAEGVASYGTGGGIVADSDPDAEFEEAMDKAQAFFRASGAARPRRA